MCSSVCTLSAFLGLLCVAGQPPNTVTHLRGAPESRPLQGLRDVFHRSSRELSVDLIGMMQKL